MKKVILSAITVALVMAFSSQSSVALAQSGRPTAARTQELPHKIGLIDMVRVFKGHKKFQALREDLKVQIERSTTTLKRKYQRLNVLQENLKKKTFSESSPQKKAWKREYIELIAKKGAEVKNKELEFMEKEAAIYKSVYREVAAAVKKYAGIYNYTLILRYTKQDIEKANTLPEVVQIIGASQVLYVRPNQDITTPVINYLNLQYKNSAGRTSHPSPR